ncbi:MAG: synthase subcomplex delta subunit [Candidatus Berkelbacteria bacterium]|nr:synthase subcomplex delta subunit [Candidatus Berkelbacteria bacterium]
MAYTSKQLAVAYPDRSQESLAELVKINTALSAGLQKLLLDPRKSLDEKIAQVNEILPKLSKNSQNFLRFLISEKLIRNFDKILFEYKNILADFVTSGEIITATPISDDELQSIKEKINHKVGKQVLLTTKVNPHIIGGAILKVGDQTVDHSFARRLRTLR